MTPEEIERLFTRNGAYAFARWGRPIAPVVFGVDDATLALIKGALDAVARLAGRAIAETDPELGANLMIFFFRDWAELRDVPNLGAMIPDLDATVARLEAVDASRYRAFRYDARGAIQAAFVFLAMRGALAELPAETIALTEAVETVLAWGEAAFAGALNIALAGPRDYGTHKANEAMINAAGRRDLKPADIDAALALFWRLCSVLTGGFVVLLLV